MNAHKKTYIKHVCDECDELFKFEDILEKHKAIHHGDLKIYCNYFNNELECLNGEKCVFLHEDSDICNYGEACERNFCMYKHKVKYDAIIEIEDAEECDEN